VTTPADEGGRREVAQCSEGARAVDDACRDADNLADAACTCRVTGTCLTCRRWDSLIRRYERRATVEAAP
jgi:hypothetical protein